MVSESINWTVDQTSIIKHLIESQNGTVSAALNELLMNLIDKKSTKCEITLTSTGFKVVDNGIGFKDRSDVENHFGCFGKKHEEGDAVFGRFRIGRGQIMALSVATWHSHEFKMTADYKNNPECFELVTDLRDYIEGCTVSGTFYTPLSDYDLRRELREISNRAKYLNIEVRVNGSIVNENVDLVKWDHEDDQIFVRYDASARSEGITLYSNGILVKQIPVHVFGLSGDVVTKQPLKLNMSRNEVSASDPIFGHISEVLRLKGLEKAKKTKVALTDGQRSAFIGQLIDNEINLEDVKLLNLLKDSRGHLFSIYTLVGRKYPITVVEDGHALSDRVASSKAATVFKRSELSKWDVQTGDDFIKMIRNIARRDYAGNSSRWLINALAELRCVDFECLASGLSSKMNMLKPNALSLRERCARNALQYASNVMATRISTLLEKTVHPRKIIIGESDAAHGWTDGITFIAVNRSVLDMLDAGEYGVTQLSLLLLHEYCHEDSDLTSHEHTSEFFDKYHQLSMSMNKKTEVVGHTASSMKTKYQSELGKNLLEDFICRSSSEFGVSTYKITTTANKGISSLGQRLIDGISEVGRLQINKKGKILTALLSRRNAPSKSVLNCLISLAETDGFTVSKFQPNAEVIRSAVTGITKTYSESWDEFRDVLKADLSVWANAKGYSTKGIFALVDYNERYENPINALSDFILNDDQSSVMMVERLATKYDMYQLRTKYLLTDISSSIQVVDKHYYNDFTKADLANKRSERLSYVSALVGEAIGTLKSDEERQAAFDVIQSGSFRDSVLSN